MNILQHSNFNLSFHQFNQIRKMSNKLSDFSPFIGYPNAGDIDAVAANNKNRSSDVYRIVKENMPKDFHVELQETANKYVLLHTKDSILKRPFDATENDLQLLQKIFTNLSIPKIERESIQFLMEDIRFQMQYATKLSKAIIKNTNHENE
ncbi:MAG: hypothetical protein H0V82_13260 [Candidatus Protochlamydia sp.]|nr:hypothetical protein [Candidatus Protochlamydia sp.]